MRPKDFMRGLEKSFRFPIDDLICELDENGRLWLYGAPRDMLDGLVILLTPRVGLERGFVLICRRGGAPLCVKRVLRGVEAPLLRIAFTDADLVLSAAGRADVMLLLETAAAFPPVILIQLLSNAFPWSSAQLTKSECSDACTPSGIIIVAAARRKENAMRIAEYRMTLPLTSCRYLR
jgi:hypothetical protein